jgi:hypothetical protein
MLAQAVTSLKGKFKWCLSGTPFQVLFNEKKKGNMATEPYLVLERYYRIISNLYVFRHCLGP